MDRMADLNKDEQKLIVELTDQFEYIEMDRLIPCLNKSLQALVDAKASYVPRILVAPLRSPVIESKSLGYILAGETKSGDANYTLFSNSFIRDSSSAAVEFCPNSMSLINKYEENAAIALIDNFIGTGETAEKYSLEYKCLLEGASKNISLEQFNIVAVAAMSFGVDALKKKYKIDSFVQILQKKAISDNDKLSSGQIVNNVNLMKSIEGKVLPKLKKDLSLGYHQSEALICIMEKSPNNTFPFYWYDNKTKTKPIFRRNI